MTLFSIASFLFVLEFQQDQLCLIQYWIHLQRPTRVVRQLDQWRRTCVWRGHFPLFGFFESNWRCWPLTRRWTNVPLFWTGTFWFPLSLSTVQRTCVKPPVHAHTTYALTFEFVCRWFLKFLGPAQMDMIPRKRRTLIIQCVLQFPPCTDHLVDKSPPLVVFRSACTRLLMREPPRRRARTWSEVNQLRPTLRTDAAPYPGGPAAPWGRWVEGKMISELKVTDTDTDQQAHKHTHTQTQTGIQTHKHTSAWTKVPWKALPHSFLYDFLLCVFSACSGKEQSEAFYWQLNA